MSVNLLNPSSFDPTRARIPDALLHLSVATRQLATMVTSGLPLVQALEVLSRQTDNPASQVFGFLVLQVERGLPLSRACALCPGVFTTVYISLLQVGEATGKLDVCLLQLSHVLEKDYAVRRQVRAAFTYPGFVVVVAGFLVLMIFYVILPNFMGIFRELNVTLPWLTRVLMVLTDALRSPGFWLFVAGAALLVRQWFQRTWAYPGGRVAIFNVLLRLPAFGKIVELGTLSRYCLVLEVMLENGVDLLRSVQLAAAASGSPVLHADGEQVKVSITHGASLSAHMAMNPHIYPGVVRHMASAGEECSSLVASLRRLAQFLDDELNYRIATLNALIEPVLMFGVGVTIGTIALAIMLPLYSFLGKLGS